MELLPAIVLIAAGMRVGCHQVGVLIVTLLDRPLAWAQSSVTRKWDVGDSSNISIDNFAGNVEIVQGPPGLISAQITTTALSKSSQAEADAAVRGVTISTSADANTVQMTTTPTGRIYKISSAITVQVPSGTAVKISTVRGEILIGSAHDKQAMPFKVPTFLRCVDAKTTGSDRCGSVELVARTQTSLQAGIIRQANSISNAATVPS